MLLHTGVKDHTPSPRSSSAASRQVIMAESAVNDDIDKFRVTRGAQTME